MATQQIELRGPRPYFAEVPYYLWGQVNYDSEGDCKRPTDREWTCLGLKNRNTSEFVSITQESDVWSIEGRDNTAALLAMFFQERCGAVGNPSLPAPEPGWDHRAAMARTARVVTEFEQPVLKPFDTHYFWGSWKWIGWYASEFTWVGRWIMHALVRNDPRAIPLCIDWLKETRFPEQASALSYAVERLSSEPARSPDEWVQWYEGGAKQRFPEADLKAWLADMKREFGEAV